MGLVGAVAVDDGLAGAKVCVTLYITEPGCLMGSLFELTARRALKDLPGVAEAEVAMDYDHVWGPEHMAPSLPPASGASEGLSRSSYARGVWETERGENVDDAFH